ncbi:unnamed protein product [Amoebophrya sp. A25]|nr:unnamed protein product [Amoebophrya sp. A25]|eukprot:GSA25T00007884001.1
MLVSSEDGGPPGSDNFLVSVVGPVHRRAGPVAKALKADKHVLCSVPMAPNQEEAKEVQKRGQAAQSGNSKLLVLCCFQLRCCPPLRDVRDLIVNNLLGVANISVVFESRRNWSFMQEGVDASWWNYRQAGGGVFSAVGIHFVDLIRFLFGDEIQWVSALQRPMRGLKVPPKADTPSAEGLCMANFITARKNIPIQMHLNGVNIGLDEEETMVITSPRASIFFDFMTSELKINTLEKQGTPVDPKPSIVRVTRDTPASGCAWSVTGMQNLTKRIWSHFEECESVHDLATMMDGLQAQRVADAVNKSGANNGEWVEIA